MAQWLVEEGIGEHRAILVEAGQVLAAKLHWPGALAPGEIADATLVARRAGSRRGTARFASGEEALVNALPPSASEGAPIRLEVTRAAMAEQGRFKRAQARPCDRPARPAPPLVERLAGSGASACIVTRFPDDPWPAIIADALNGTIAFENGEILVSPTPAMTLIDVDGTLAPGALALAAIPAIADAIAQFDLGGSIGIDFPSLERKEERRRVDEALAAALDHWPHQSTAMNGFGFVQLVARSEGPSILQRVRTRPRAAAARLLLRRAEQVTEPGVLLLSAHPAVRAEVRAEWEAELARRTGRPLRWNCDAGLAIHAGFAQAVSS